MGLNLGDYRARKLIADGDWIGELTSRGWPRSAPRERANLDQPNLVRDVAESFLDAGSEALVTNTAAANRVQLAALYPGQQRPERVQAMVRAGAEVCRKAADEFPGRRTLVFGEIGPVEQLLSLREIDELELFAAYREQAVALAAGGVDAILCRRFTEIAALEVAVRAARSTNLPVAGCLRVDSGPDGMETALGGTLDQAWKTLQDARASMWGCDGGESPDHLPQVLAAMAKMGELPIWAELSPGIAQLMGEIAVFPESPKEYASRLKPLLAAGATFVGGSRGASAQHIASLVKARELLKKDRRKPAP